MTRGLMLNGMLVAIGLALGYAGAAQDGGCSPVSRLLTLPRDPVILILYSLSLGLNIGLLFFGQEMRLGALSCLAILLVMGGLFASLGELPCGARDAQLSRLPLAAPLYREGL